MQLEDLTKRTKELQKQYEERLKYLGHLDKSISVEGISEIDVFDQLHNTWSKMPLRAWREFCAKDMEKVKAEYEKFRNLEIDLQTQLTNGLQQIEDSNNEPTHLDN